MVKTPPQRTRHTRGLFALFILSLLIISFQALSAWGDTNAPSSHADSYLVTIHAAHRARLIDNHIEALENYLEMIGRAHKSINIEAFVFNPDRSGSLVLQALTRKADQGVKVRILVDYYSNRLKSGLDGFYAIALARHGIELRYFNVADLLDLGKIGFRNHRKLLVVDDREMVIGGRNIADEYFGMAEKVNYLDRDVWLEGPIAREASRHFELYWQSEVVSHPKFPSPPAFTRSPVAASSKRPTTKTQDQAIYAVRLAEYESLVSRAQKNLSPQPEDEMLRQHVARLGKEQLAQSPIVIVHSITLASDKPIPGETGRVVTPYLMDRLAKVQRSLLIENFLFLCKDQEKELFLSLLERKVRIDLLTNGLNSDPNFIMAELANSRQNMAVRHGMNVYCYCDAPDSDKIFSGKKSIWGLHTKSIVIDNRDSVIGSHNFDPRSASINAEGILIINDSPEFAALLAQKIHHRMKNATRMNEDGSYANGYHCYSAGRALTIFLRPLVEIFTDLL